MGGGEAAQPSATRSALGIPLECWKARAVLPSHGGKRAGLCAPGGPVPGVGLGRAWPLGKVALQLTQPLGGGGPPVALPAF